MRDELPLPTELLHLVEKRQAADRRKTSLAKGASKPSAERRKATRRQSKRAGR